MVNKNQLLSMVMFVPSLVSFYMLLIGARNSSVMRRDIIQCVTEEVFMHGIDTPLSYCLWLELLPGLQIPQSICL